MAYREYGAFFRSRAVQEQSKYFKANGFLDKSATYDNRYDKSIEYLKNSVQLLTKSNKLDKVSSSYLNMGITYEIAGKTDKACEAYKRARKSIRSL